MRLMLAAAGSVLALAAAPALAHDGGQHAAYASPHGYPAMQAPFRIDPALAARCGLHAGSFRPHEYAPVAYHDSYDRGRRGDGRDDGLGGALIGGAVGGLVGNRVAGRGDRTVGTIAGAAVGAVAGAAIDRADDRRDYAPEHDADWDHRAAGGYAGECADALPPGYTLISIPGSRECHDEVSTIEEWVPETVTIPGASYSVPQRAAPLRDKRTKLRRVK